MHEIIAIDGPASVGKSTLAKKLSLRFIPFLFIAVTILTAFGSNNGIWV